jgi:hypothetical protein
MLRTNLQPSAGCLPLERFTEPLTSPEQQHIAACARCRTELTLFTEFMESQPAPGEGAAVQWIGQELRRRQSASSERRAPAAVRSWWAGLFRHRLAVAASAVALVAAVALFIPRSEPDLRGPGPRPGDYRSREFKAIGPLGDKKVAPTTFEWESVPGVVKYDVTLLEVDGTVVWETSVGGTTVALPQPVQALIVPGKTLRWKVVARDSAGASIAETSTQEFRVIS